MSKKKIFAIIIFIVFGLFMFSFANPIEIDNPYGQVEVDKTKLKDAIDRGTALIEKHGTGSDVLKELDEAVKDGKDVYDDESTQDEVDDATKRIEDAIKNLEDDIMNRANISLYPNTLAPSTFVNLITTVTIDDNQYIDSVKFVVGTNCYANGTNLVLDANNQAVTRVTANSTYTSCLFLTNGTVKQASQTIGNINAEVPDTEAPVISLNGKELIKIVLGKTTYEDELARVIDNVDPEREIAGELVGKVDEIGSYELRYNAKDSAGNEATEVVRTIKVLDPKGDEDNDGFTNEEEIDAKTDLDDPESHPETEAPTITLKGKNPYIMLQNRKYVEAGVEITLDVHDTITTIDDVVVKGSVDTTKVGVYTITYTITDRYGKTASVERTVKVLDPNGDEDNDGFTNEEEIEKPLEPTNPDEPKGENNPLVETDPTDPEDDNSHPETYAPSITLNGEDLLCLEVHSEYIEKGVSIVLDPHDTITTIDDVVVTGSVDTDTLGEYILTYTVTDRYGKTASVTRTIDVIDSQAPVINLNGNSTITLERESEYVELGASVTDNYDKDLVAIITGSVDTNTLGTYYIRYNATDSSGNKATEVVRTVIVVRSENDKKVASISAVLNPTTYDRGTNAYGDLTVTATDNDGTTHVLNTSEYTVTGWDSSLEVGSESASRKLTIVLNSDNTISTTVDYEIVRSESDKQLNRIEATLEKTEYKRGEEIETLRVTAYDNDGTSYDVTNVSGHDFDSTTVGDKTLTVTYKEKTDTVDYRVVRNDEDKKVASISAVLNPTIYDRGTNTYGDLTVTATDNDGTTHVLNTSEYTVTGWDSSLEVGNESASRKLTIVLNSDNTISTTVDYEIVRSESDKQLNRIEATLEKTEYKRGEEIKTLRVTAYDNDGTSYDVTNEASHDFDSTTVGDKTLLVGYKGKTDTVDYRVVRNDEDKKVASISAVLNPTTYDRGTNAYGDLTVTATDNDGTTHVLNTSEYTVTGWDSSLEVGSESASRKLTIVLNSDNTISTTVDYEIVRSESDKQLNRIEATLEKTEYKRGEEIETLRVTAYDNDGTSYDVTNVSGHDFDSTTVGDKTLTVTYKEKTDTVDYRVVRNDEDKKVASISAVLNPTTYDRGTNAYGDLTVTATDNDGTTHVLNTSEYTVTGWDSSLEVGNESASRKLTIVLNSDNTISTTVDYEIVRSESDKQLNRIEATLEKTEYKRGEEIETLRVTAYDNDGTSYDVTNVSGHDFDSTTVGDKTLTVTYKEKTDTVDYKVVRNDEDKQIKELTAELEKDVYKRGEAMSNIVVTRIDNDGTRTILDSTQYTLTGFSTEVVGTFTVTVTHDNLTATDTYTVERNDEDKQIKELTAELEKDVYKRGEAMSNIVVTRIDNDGTRTILDSTQYTLTGFSTEVVGTFTVTVTHDNLTATDTYTVGDIEIDIKTPALTVSGKNAEPGQIVDYEISLSTDMTEVSLPTYTIEIGEGMVLESCPANATCNGNTITWTPTSVDEKLNYSAKVGNNVPAGSVIKTTVKENNKVVKEFDTNIEVTVEVSTSQTTATSLEVVLTLDVSGSMWQCSKGSWFTCESTKIEDLISVTKQFVTDLNNKNTNGSTINLTIITFGRRKDNACFDNKTCYETLYTGGLTSTTLTGINNAIDTIDDNGENRGGTHLYGALNSALNIINNSTLNNKYLVVLGDGEPNDEDNYNVINNLKTTTANVFSIGFKVSRGSKAERVLKSVVNNNDSHYFSADNSSSLEESFNTIQESIDTQAVQTVNGNIEANALNAKSIEISHSGMTKVTITDLSEINLSNYNISIVEGKFVWNVSKYPGNTNYKMIVNY